MKITMELSEKQYKIITRALDLYSRIQMGQLHEIVQVIAFESGKHIEHPERHKVNNLLSEVKQYIFGLDNNAYNSICSDEVSESAKISYEIKQVMDSKLAWNQNPEGGWQVQYDEPFEVTKYDLPVVEIID